MQDTSRADIEVSSKPREEERVEPQHQALSIVEENQQVKRARRAESSDGSNLGVTTASAPMPEPSAQNENTRQQQNAPQVGEATATNERPPDDQILKQLEEIR